MTIGRSPQPGEVIVGSRLQSDLQLIEPSSSILDGDASLPIVGAFQGSGSLKDLDRLVLIGTDVGNRPTSTLVYILASNAAAVDRVVKQIVVLAGVQDSDDLSIETSSDLIELGLVVSGQVGALGRQLALVAVGTGMALVALTMALATNARKKDIGRRRALGASRSAVLGLSIFEGLIPTCIGTILGTLGGVAILILTLGNVPSVTFIGATTTLILLAGAISSLPAAAAAAWQDPVRVLRVP